MNIIRVFRLSMRVAEWAAPHIEEWHRKRNLDRNEGQRHLKAGNWPEAEVHFATALAEGKHSGQKRWEMLVGLAAAQRGQRKLDSAEETACLAAELGRTAGNHGWQMQSLNELADIQLTREDYVSAQNTAEAILSREGARPKPDKGTLAGAARKLGIALAKADNRTEAAAAFQQAVQLSEEALGKDHVDTARNLTELGSLYGSQGNHAEAQRCLRRAVEIHRASSGGDSAETSQSLLLLANSLSASGDPDAACSEYERVLKLREQQIGANPEETLDAQINLARLYIEAGRTPAARELLILTVGKLDRRGGPRLISALELMVQAEQLSGRAAEAARWQQKLEAVGQPAKRPDIMAQFGRAQA